MTLTTSRLVLREAEAADAAFVVALLNDPAFLEFIGDREVRTEADALGYVSRLRAGYTKHGFGLYVVTRADTGLAVGLCGLVVREALPEPDLGFAFLAEHRRQGYGREAALAALQHARGLGLTRLLAICSPLNVASRRLLEQLGFGLERMLTLPGEKLPTCLYAREVSEPLVARRT